VTKNLTLKFNKGFFASLRMTNIEKEFGVINGSVNNKWNKSKRRRRNDNS